MQSIKFRVWNGEKMLTAESAVGWGKNLLLKLNGELWLVDSLENNYTELDFPVMMFTGLYDKENNPIYEGDIVDFETFDCQAVVVYEAPEFVAKDSTGEWHSLRRYGCSVVGNVHEKGLSAAKTQEGK